MVAKRFLQSSFVESVNGRVALNWRLRKPVDVNPDYSSSKHQTPDSVAFSGIRTKAYRTNGAVLYI